MKQRDVVEAVVKDARVDHSISGEGHHGTDNGSSNYIIPVWG